MQTSPAAGLLFQNRLDLAYKQRKRKTNDTTLAHKSQREEMNVRQANGLGRVHVAKPQMRETYCGRPIDEDDWITTSKEADCTGCARAGAPMPRKPEPEGAPR